MKFQPNVVDEAAANEEMAEDRKRFLATLPDDYRAELEARDRELSDEGEGDDDDQT